ncbi:hypothetical protein TNCV_5022951 [Trichonephila clavipes]|nr:hypothetical protein TNCV_5022951 [Trichonephila clavipes]
MPGWDEILLRSREKRLMVDCLVLGMLVVPRLCPLELMTTHRHFSETGREKHLCSFQRSSGDAIRGVEAPLISSACVISHKIES